MRTTRCWQVDGRLVEELGARAVVVGMDGFHLANETLERLGLRNVKGAPETFDADGFVALLERIRSPIASRPIHAPVYDRSLSAATDTLSRADHTLEVGAGLS